MDFREAYRRLTEKFTSGNEVDVERTTLKREEWEAILPALQGYNIHICDHPGRLFDGATYAPSAEAS